MIDPSEVAAAAGILHKPGFAEGAFCLGVASMAWDRGYPVTEEQVRELAAVDTIADGIRLARAWWPGPWIDGLEITR
jgi:hypothetical protein